MKKLLPKKYRELVANASWDTQTKKVSFLVALLVLLSLYPLVYPHLAHATAPTVFYVRFDRLSTGAAISGTACINTTTTGTEGKVAITFPSDWTTSTTAADWTTSTTNLPSGATAWTTIQASATSATGANGGTVVWTSGDLSTSTLYCFNFAGANSTLGSAADDLTGVFETQTSGGSAIDTSDYATSVVASNADQVTVTATVPATFSFALSGTSIGLSTLSTSSVTSGNVTMTISTNARNGWVSWLKHSGFSSATTGTSISTPGSYPTISDLASTTGFVVDADATTGSPTIAAGFDGTNATSGGNPSTTYDQLASKGSAVSGNVVTINARAKISATQQAASDYTDTLTITAAGNF